MLNQIIAAAVFVTSQHGLSLIIPATDGCKFRKKSFIGLTRMAMTPIRIMAAVSLFPVASHLILANGALMRDRQEQVHVLSISHHLMTQLAIIPSGLVRQKVGKFQKVIKGKQTSPFSYQTPGREIQSQVWPISDLRVRDMPSCNSPIGIVHLN